MAERRKAFERRFKHVWGAGPTGCSKFYVTAPSEITGRKLVTAIFTKTLAADVEQQNLYHKDQSYKVTLKRDFITNPDLHDWVHRDENYRITGVTNDDRVAELIEEAALHRKSIGSAEVPFDMIIVPMINASPDYIDWIKLQTMKKDGELAHYNMEPEAEMHGLDNRIGEINQIADRRAADSYLHPELNEPMHVQLQSKAAFAEGDEDEDSTAENEAAENEIKDKE